MFRFSPACCPQCGQLPHVIYEEVTVRAFISLNEQGFMDYDGESDVIWDSQQPAYNKDKTVELECGNCVTHWEAQLIEPGKEGAA